MSIRDQLKFDANGLIAAITRDADSGEVLMLAWMNAEAVQQTLDTGKVHYWSRSRQALWLKGETSGHFQTVRAIRLDCDGDALLIDIDQEGAACHTGARSCFYRRLDGETLVAEVPTAPADVLRALAQVIDDRKGKSPDASYVAKLFAKGLDKILGKIGEEATEVAVAGKGGNPDEVVAEMADLWFHCLVLLGQYEIPPQRITDELRRRFGLSGLVEKANRPQ